MTISTRVFLFSLFLLAAGCAKTKEGGQALHQSQIDDLIQSEMTKQRIPGISLAIVSSGATWEKGYGLADVENGVKVEPSTIFRLASISKTMTATAAVQLWEKGKLGLDAPVETYCPSFPAKPWRVTARQLLSHLGGIRHYNEAEEVSSTVHYTDIIEPLKLFSADPLLHEPGTKFEYSTYGYNLLGCAIEGASGTPFVSYLRENVFAPSGMQNTGPDDSWAIIANRAQGYRMTKGKLTNSPTADTSNKIPGGGLSATAKDLIRFAEAFRGGKLVTKSSFDEMIVERRGTDQKPTEYGWGWILSTRKGVKEVWHTGGQERVSTILYLLPEKHVAVALLSNLEEAKLTELARKVGDLLLETP